MRYTRQYKTFMNPEVIVSRNMIKPRNLYKITTYSEGNPATKMGDKERYVFVIGKVGGMIHCILLNEIRPLDFFNFLNKVRNKQVKLTEGQTLNETLKRFTLDGKSLFENYIKRNPKVYLTGEKNNYRTYFLNKITKCSEIQFESDFLKEIFNEKGNSTTRSVIIKTEINDGDEH